MRQPQLSRGLFFATLVWLSCSNDASRSDSRTSRQTLRARTDAAAMYQEMSTMGAVAAGVAPAPDPESSASLKPLQGAVEPTVIGSTDTVVHSATAIGTQAETSIASNTTGSVLIAGYNDSRGFATTPVSLSGIARSVDNGVTWAEVPVGPGGAGTLPSVTGGSVFGDPDVKYDPTRNRFVYASIYVRPSDSLQGMSVHVSNTDGTQWTGPIEVTPSFISGAAADKEFIDVNPVTGRIVLTWTNFGASTQILSTFSDDFGSTWSAATVLVTAAAGTGVQASVPRFLPGTTNANSSAYAVWRTTSATGQRNIACVRSTNGGQTWSAPVLLDTDYAAEDQILGVDRVNNSPAMAVDHTSGRVYVVYQRNNAQGEGDIALRTFVGDCVTGTPVLLDSNPGADRAQFYPFVTVDQGTRRVEVGFYDQGVFSSGDAIELMHTSSTDQGTTWSPPTPISDRPFSAGFGNDTSQPNLGDYNQGIAFGGNFYTLFSMTSIAPRFDEGQPASTQMITPDVVGDVTVSSRAVAPLRVVSTTVGDATYCTAGANGLADPGELVDLSVVLTNYVANAAVGATTVTGISAHLSTTTSGVSVQRATSTYGNLSPLASAAGAQPFVFSLSPSFLPGTPVDFLLDVTTTQGTTQLAFRVATGTPGAASTILNEDFTTTTITVSQTPATNVWASVRGGGATSLAPWGIAQTLTPGNNAAFYSEGTTIGFLRLFSPVVAVPAAAGQSVVTVDFDLVYNLEDEPAQRVLAYDGLTLRVTDQTSGATLRSVLAEAFAEQIRTGTALHFPKHLPRNNNSAYFQDMSVWSGDSAGMVHVAVRMPGAGMAGRSVQLRFEYTQDSSGVCATPPCGVAIDNVVMRAVPTTSAACTPAPAACGNGLVEAGEQCEGASTCCVNCQFTTAVCRASTGQCDAAESCTAGVCPPDAPAANGTSCNDSDACTQTDTCQAGACTGANPVTCTASDQCHVAGTCNPVNGTCSNPVATNGTSCNDSNSCTQTDVCQAGICTGANPVTCVASDQCHVAGTCNPSTGTCSNPNAANGTSCNDSNACTQSDTCQAGTCTGANPVTCSASDQCHVAGTCNPSTGTCSNPNANDGTSCNDSNACTQSDTCQAGACTGANPVTCTASDQCHVAGTCNPANGTCSNPVATNGTSCNDSNSCTQTDTCQAGTCTGANPVTCVASDQCHVAGTCNPANGTCSNPNANDGTSCNDSNACTQSDTCQAGACTGANPVTCTASDQCHVAGTCNPADGTCSNPNAANGTSCNDSNACTQSDTCQAGACTGANPVTCAASDQCHVAGTCNPANGTCSNPNAADGTSCNDANSCTQTDSCQAGTCTGANPVTCLASDQCHVAGVCNPANGTCSNPAAPNGTTCNDGNGCTQADTCQAGACTAGTPVVCQAVDQCHSAGTCDVATGACSTPTKADGTSCDDSNACTQTDSCQAGSCTGTNPVTCTAMDSCHVAGTCDTATGTCSNPNAADGVQCNDSNACTQTDTCQSGTCTGGNPVTCTAMDSCHTAGTCDATTGACSNPVAADGTACNDSNGCTMTDTCTAGTCMGSNPKTCTPSDQCHTEGTCDATTGLCSNPAKADGTSCNDSNACTQTDSCQAGTCTGGNPKSCTASDECHTAGTCDPGTGTCSNPNAENGTMCTLGSTAGQCSEGTCAPKAGCGCSAIEPSSLIGAVLLLGALRRRRRSS